MTLFDQARNLIGIGNGESTERKPVLLTDLTDGSSWKSKKGPNIRINTTEPLDYTIYSSDPTVAGEVFDGLEDLRQKLEARGYTLTQVAPSKEDVAHNDVTADPGVQSDGMNVSAQVIDIAEARVSRGTLTMTDSPVLETTNLSDETSTAYEAITAKLKETSDVIMFAIDGADKEALQKKVINLLDQAEAFKNEKEQVEGADGTDQAALASLVSASAERAHLEKLRDIDQQVTLLFEEAKLLKKAKTPKGTARATRRATTGLAHAVVAGEPVQELVTRSVIAKPGNRDALSQAMMHARKAEDIIPPVVNVKSDGADGDGEGLEEVFKTLLEARRKKVELLIDALATPQDFALFRRTLRKVEMKDSKGAKWYCMNQDTLVEELNNQEGLSEKRKLHDAEKKQLYVTEDFLRDKIRRKFFTLQDADVARFYDQEQAKIMATQSEADLEGLVASWPKQLEDIATWKEAFDALTEVEKNKIDDGYREAVSGLKQDIEVRRRELQMAPAYEALDAFVKGQPNGKETIVLLQDIIREAYRVFSEKVTKESQGKISEKDCEELWRQKNGEQRLQAFVVNHLHVIEGVEPGEGEKIFRASIARLQEGR